MKKIKELREENARDLAEVKKYQELVKRMESDIAVRDLEIKERTIIKPALVWHGCPTEFAERIKRDVADGLITTVDGKKNVHLIMHEYCRIINFVSTKAKKSEEDVFITENSMQSYMRRDTGATVKKTLGVLLILLIQKLLLLSSSLLGD